MLEIVETRKLKGLANFLLISTNFLISSLHQLETALKFFNDLRPFVIKN